MYNTQVESAPSYSKFDRSGRKFQMNVCFSWFLDSFRSTCDRSGRVSAKNRSKTLTRPTFSERNKMIQKIAIGKNRQGPPEQVRNMLFLFRPLRLSHECTLIFDTMKRAP